jgi:hypothetical protein
VTCKRCKKDKDPSDFHNKKRMKSGKHPNCKECVNARYRVYRKEYDAKNRDKTKSHYLKWYYDITIEDFYALAERQGHRCAICRTEFSKLPRKPSVDHCHVTGRIRGLLCYKCNTSIGFLLDNPALVYAAMIYLLQGGINYEHH